MTTFAQPAVLKSPSKECLKDEKMQEKKRFLDWLSVFIIRTGFRPPLDMSSWYDRVEQQHDFVRKTIGGKMFAKSVAVPRCSVSLDEAIADKFRQLIFVMLDQVYFESIGRQAMSNVKLDLNLFLQPTRKDAQGRTRKNSKAIMNAVITTIKLFTADTQVIAQVEKELSPILGKLGETWANLNTLDRVFDICLTTSPGAFCLLGHYSSDSRSCFQAGKENDWHKIVLGQTPNSFVLLVREDGCVVARFWGVWDEEKLVVCNGYYYKGAREIEIQGALKIFFSDILGVKSEDHELVPGAITVTTGLYHNVERPDWVFINKDFAGQKNYRISSNLEDISFVPCHHCGNSRVKYSCHHYKDAKKRNFYVCSRCYPTLTRCDRCNEKIIATFFTGYSGSERISENEVTYCEKCKEETNLTACARCGFAHTNLEGFCVYCLLNSKARMFLLKTHVPNNATVTNDQMMQIKTQYDELVVTTERNHNDLYQE